MGAICPYYSNVVIEQEDHKKHIKVFGYKDTPPKTTPKPYEVETVLELYREHKFKRHKKRIAIATLITSLFCAIGVGVYQTLNQPIERPVTAQEVSK